MFAMQQEEFFKGSPGAAAPWGNRWLGSLWHIAWSARWREACGTEPGLHGGGKPVAHSLVCAVEGSLWHIAWSARWRALPGSQGPPTGTEVPVAGASGTLPLPPHQCAPRFQVNFLKGEFFLSTGT